MSGTMSNQDMVRYTTVLPVSYINTLKGMAQDELIASVNQGIRMAVEEFIASQKRIQYECEMRAASQDKDFMERTLDTQTDFAEIDQEEMKSW